MTRLEAARYVAAYAERYGHVPSPAALARLVNPGAPGCACPCHDPGAPPAPTGCPCLSRDPEET